jgi:hypothetical protein
LICLSKSAALDFRYVMGLISSEMFIPFTSGPFIVPN